MTLGIEYKARLKTIFSLLLSFPIFSSSSFPTFFYFFSLCFRKSVDCSLGVFHRTLVTCVYWWDERNLKYIPRLGTNCKSYSFLHLFIAGLLWMRDREQLLMNIAKILLRQGSTQASQAESVDSLFFHLPFLLVLTLRIRGRFERENICGIHKISHPLQKQTWKLQS